MDFPSFVDLENVKVLLDSEHDLRYYLKIPLQYNMDIPQKSVLVILKNPSTAKVDHDMAIYESDQTVDRVLRYFHKNKYTEVVIVNLFARYYTYSENLNDYVNSPDLIVGKSNDEHVIDFLESGNFERFVVAWGGYPKDAKEKMKVLYRKRIKALEKILDGKDVYYVEKMVDNDKFPKHGMTWTLNAPMKRYNNRFYFNSGIV